MIAAMPLLLTVWVQTTRSTDVDCREAAQKALWFSHCMGFEQPCEVTGMSLRREDGTNGVPVYVASITEPVAKRSYEVLIDAHSCDVVSARLYGLKEDGLCASATDPNDVRLKALFKDRQLIYDSATKRFYAGVKGVPLARSIHDRSVILKDHRGALARFEMIGGYPADEVSDNAGLTKRVPSSDDYVSRGTRAGISDAILGIAISKKLSKILDTMEYLKMSDARWMIDENGAATIDNRNQHVYMAASGAVAEYRTMLEADEWNSDCRREKAEKAIRFLVGPLPEGGFYSRNSKGNPTRLEFVQKALGFEYLDSPLGTVQLSSDGSIASFQGRSPNPVPVSLPALVLDKADIQRKALALAISKLPADTPTEKHSVDCEVKAIGWHMVPGKKEPTLAYQVAVSLRTARPMKEWGDRRLCWFDAMTGEPLR